VRRADSTFPGARRRRPHRRKAGERGQALAESAIIIPIFLVLIVGVIEVTNAMNAYVTIVSSARDGARLGSKGLASDTEIKNLVVTETDRLRDPVDPINDITVTHPTIDGAEAVRVEVCQDYTLLLGIDLVMPDTFRMCSTTSMRDFTPSS
jgi:Flp pilus assembly protein TadG